MMDCRLKCKVRARIPFAHSPLPVYVYLYDWIPSSSSSPSQVQQHLAVVYGKAIRSNSLEAKWSDQESEFERRARGADQFEEAYNDEPVVVRIHSSCFTGETLHSLRCDCGAQLQHAMEMIIRHGYGIVLYLNQEGRGIGLEDKLRAYNLQDFGYDTVEANVLLNHPPDARDYECAAEMLRDLNVNSVQLLTNNPDKIEQLERNNIAIRARVPILPYHESLNQDAVGSDATKNNSCSIKKTQRLSEELVVYLETKASQMRHILPQIQSVVRNKQ